MHQGRRTSSKPFLMCNDGGQVNSRCQEKASIDHHFSRSHLISSEYRVDGREFREVEVKLWGKEGCISVEGEQNPCVYDSEIGETVNLQEVPVLKVGEIKYLAS